MVNCVPEFEPRAVERWQEMSGRAWRQAEMCAVPFASGYCVDRNHAKAELEKTPESWRQYRRRNDAPRRLDTAMIPLSEIQARLLSEKVVYAPR